MAANAMPTTRDQPESSAALSRRRRPHASINPASGDIAFSPCAQAGDLWAYDEEPSDGNNVQHEVSGSQAGGAGSCNNPPAGYPLVPLSKISDPSYPR